ncbi:MAG: protein kinase, partial [Gemmatimonadales bacterium]|nr:protein kinase [Gemmatimonadales bacterium]
PHILPLLDSGSVSLPHPERSEGSPALLYYVMPLVTGETLRARLERERQLPIADAVRIAREVASALDYAHRQGVIHRDIKPENILLHDGQAMVADFGIALAVQSAGGARMTQTGLSLGTPQYMSPEQAMGERQIDARSDVYALAAVTYEMLAGDAPFTGGSVQAIVAKIMTEKPTPVHTLRDTVPEHVEDAVLTGLAKLPADRFASAAEFASALGDEGSARTTATPRNHASHSAVSGNRTRTVLLVAGVGVLAAALGWFGRGTALTPADTAPIEFAFRLGDGSKDRPHITLSDDGRRIAMAVEDSTGVTRVVLRDIGSTALTAVVGTEGARDPAFSPDGEWLAFVRNGQVQKVPVAGGPTTVLVDSSSNSSAVWSVGGEWLYYTKQGDGLWRVPAAGGGAERLTTIDTTRQEFNHWSPQALPGGKVIIYTSYTTPLSRARIEAVEIASGRKTVLVEGAVYARYAGGILFYARDAAIFGVRLDPRTLEVEGAAIPVLEDVAWRAPDAIAGFAVAPNGTMVYLRESEWSVKNRVVWVDRSGATESAIPNIGHWAEPRLSPDARWIALSQTQPKRDIWLYDRGRGVLSQLTRAPAAAFNPLWNLDSRSIIYTNEDPVYDLNHIPIDASSPSTVLYASPYDKRATSISPDGERLAFVETVDRDLLGILPLGADTATRVDERSASQRSAMFSPDGRWLVYEEANRDEQSLVYARRLNGQSGRVQVSPGSGNQPRWARGGREIVYRRGGAMLAVSFDPATGDVGTPTTLFTLPDAGQVDSRSYGYDVTPDGSRFLVVMPIEQPGVQPVHVILNWLEHMRTKMAQ